MFIETSEVLQSIFIDIGIILGFFFLLGNIVFWSEFFEIRRKQIALMQYFKLKYDDETQTMEQIEDKR